MTDSPKPAQRPAPPQRKGLWRRLMEPPKYSTLSMAVFGVIGGIFEGTRLDAAIQAFNLIGLSGPVFWVGLMLLVGASSLLNFGSWTISGESTVTDLGHGARLIVKQTKGPVDVKLTLVVFDSDHCSIRILSQQTLMKAKTAAEMLGDGLAIFNGGYFGLTPEGFHPSGLEIAESVRTGAFAPVGSSRVLWLSDHQGWRWWQRQTSVMVLTSPSVSSAGHAS